MARIHRGIYMSGAEKDAIEGGVANIETMLGGQRFAIQSSNWSFIHHPSLNDLQITEMVASGRTPAVLVHTTEGHDQNTIDVLDAINTGMYDGHAQYWANFLRQVAPAVTIIRFLHEANCCYDWRVLGGDAARGVKFRAAWDRLYNIFHTTAPSVKVMWCCNDEGMGNNIDYQFLQTFPGWDKMDCVGIDSYWNEVNGDWNFTPGDHYSLLKYTIDHLNQLGMQASGKKLFMGEWGVKESTAAGQNKGAILKAVFDNVFPSIPNLLGIISQHTDEGQGRSNWYINSSQGSIDAYKAGFANGHYTDAMLIEADFVGGAPPPPPPPTDSLYASDQPYVVVSNGWGVAKKDLSIEGRPLKLAGVTYAKGFGLHANAELTVPVPAGVTRFTAMGGIDDEVQAGTGSVEFSAGFGTTVLQKSPVMKQGQVPFAFDVDVTGKTSVTLKVTSPTADLNWDHADIVDAKFAKGETPVPADLTPRVTALETSVTTLKADVATLKTDVATLKTDVAKLKTDVAALAAKKHTHTVTVSQS